MSKFWDEKKLGLWVSLFLFILAIFIWVRVAQSESREFIVRMYDVGQGDSIFIQTPLGYKILVDGGGNSTVLDHLNRDLGLGDRKIDLVILTHPQEDHLKGLVEVVKHFQVGKVITTEAENKTVLFKMWLDTLSERNLQTALVEAGDSIQLADGVTIQFVWPAIDLTKVTDLNQASIVFKLSYGELDILLTGDADSSVQPYSGNIGKIEVLKVPHHGSKTGLSEDFLNLLQPEVSLISLGKNNRYGHPGQNILDMLQAVGSTIYRTDQNGTIEIVSNGERWYTRTER